MENLPPGVHLVEDLADFPLSFPPPDPGFVFNTQNPAASYRRVAHWAQDLLAVRARCDGNERPVLPIRVVGSGQDAAVRALARTLPKGVEILSFGGEHVFAHKAGNGSAKRSVFFLLAR